jgi:hypothetical protein
MHEPLRLSYEQDPDEAPKKGLYVTDREIIRRLGFGKTRGYQILHELDVERPGRRRYPQKDPMFCRRRFWPAVLRWHMDYHLGHAASSETTGVPPDQPQAMQDQNTAAPHKARLESLVNIYSGGIDRDHAADNGARTSEDGREHIRRTFVNGR